MSDSLNKPCLGDLQVYPKFVNFNFRKNTWKIDDNCTKFLGEFIS